MSLEPGSILRERYRIEAQLGKGGMGAVYLATDLTLGIRVAVKENLNLNPESERQFRREASLLATLRHPNLPRVTDHFVLEGRQYLVMDYIEGVDLHTRAERQPATLEEAMAWAMSVADALEYLHSRTPPVIHRDIKPSNIKLQPDGAVVLVDFGIAKVFDEDHTTTGARGMTPGFSPPEQYGSGRTDPRSDQYALAATIYSLLTGKPPADSIERMLNDEIFKAARALNPAIPAQVDAALTRALSIQQSDRFPTLAAFRAALQGLGSEETVRAAAPLPARPAPARTRRRWLLPALAGAGALALVLAGGGAALALLSGASPTPPLPSATLVEVGLASTPTATATPPPPTATAAPTGTGPPPSATPAAAPVALLGGGGRIAFSSDREDGQTLQLWTMLPDGSDPRQLTFGPGDKTQPNWSPDGARLAFVAPGRQDAFGNDLGLDVFVLNADGTGLRNVTHAAGNDTEPVWSPDGGRLAFTSDRIGAVRQVFVIETACLDAAGDDACWGVKPKRISCTSDFCAVEYSPDWSPEGATVAVAASINGAPGRIYLRSPEGGEPTAFDRRDLVIGASELAWSPDGKFLAFTWLIARGRNEIYLVSLDNPQADPIQLTNSLGNKEPAYSPDGQWIVFTSTRDQNPEIYLMSSQGSNEVNLTQSPSSRDLQPDWQPLSLAP